MLVNVAAPWPCSRAHNLRERHGSSLVAGLIIREVPRGVKKQDGAELGSEPKERHRRHKKTNRDKKLVEGAVLPHGKVKRQRQVTETRKRQLARRIKEERKVEGYRDRSS